MYFKVQIQSIHNTNHWQQFSRLQLPISSLCSTSKTSATEEAGGTTFKVHVVITQKKQPYASFILPSPDCDSVPTVPISSESVCWAGKALPRYLLPSYSVFPSPKPNTVNIP